MKRSILTAVLAVFAAGSAYAGGFESDRAASGVKFGESLITEEAPAVNIAGELKAAKQESLKFSEVRKPALKTGIPLPARTLPETVKTEDVALVGMGALATCVGIGALVFGIPSIFMIGVIGAAAVVGFGLLGLKKLITNAVSK